MVKKKMYKRIQTLKRRGHSKTEIAAALNIDPATVRKYYDMGPDEYHKYLQQVIERKKSFEAYEEEIKELYSMNDFKKLNMAAVYDYLEERYGKLPGNEQTLRNYIHYLVKNEVLVLTNKQRMYSRVDPLPYGKQLQIDFGEYTTKRGWKLYIFGAVLSASRFKYIAFQDHPFRTIDVIYHLLDCFDYLGGMPEELVIDQDSVLVVSENYGNIVYTRQFSQFIDEMELKMYVCRKSDPESKGKIENVIKFVKYNFLQVRDFEGVEEARESLTKWLKRRGNGKISQATKKVPLYEIEEERNHLRPLQNSLFRKNALVGREMRLVSEKSYIMVAANEYSVPQQYRNRTVEIYLTPHEVYIYDEKTGREIACHTLSPLTGKRVQNRDHFRSKTFPIEELHRKTMQLYTFESWKLFIHLNVKAFKRYSRDQCMLAGKYFKKVEDESILEMAVEYCLENNTYSMTELKDTYDYMLTQHTQEQQLIHQAVLGALRTTRPEALTVSKRRVEEYETLVSPLPGEKL
jgi:transposase